MLIGTTRWRYELHVNIKMKKKNSPLEQDSNPRPPSSHQCIESSVRDQNISHEINFGASTISKSVIFAIWESLNFEFDKFQHSRYRFTKYLLTQNGSFRISAHQNWFHIKSEWQKNPGISTLCPTTVWKNVKFSLTEKNSSNQLFSNFFIKPIAFTKFFSNICESEFP